MHIPAYRLAAKELASNREQLTAYESKGHFVALAGPGSGKTKVLTTKLARMMHEDIDDPRGIACVTYSNECARELKRRLAKLGLRPNRRIFVGTVHSFCFQHIVRPFALLGGLKIANPIEVVTDIRRKNCFGEAVENRLGKDENPWNWEIRCSSYRRLHLDRQSPTWLGDDKAAAQVILEYERILRSRGLIDFDDMMFLGLKLVEDHDWVRRALNAKFPVLVVDEYQDLGLPLHHLVLQMCFSAEEQQSRLFAVGDPDQSIYGFTGARPELLRQLSERIDVESVTLQLNYRSRQSLISASEFALGANRGYKSVNKEKGVVEFHQCDDGLEHQAKHIVTNIIPTVLENGIASSLGEIAVLYCTKGEGDVIDEQTALASLDFIRVDGNAAYAKTPLTRWLEDCAAWCTARQKDKLPPSLRMIINEYLGLFNRNLKSAKSRLESSHQLVAMLRSLVNEEQGLHGWIATIADSVLRPCLSADPSQAQELSVLNKFIESTGSGGKLSDWTVARFGGQGGSPDHLNLMTLHSSKGLEFDVVILFGMDQGIIPSYRQTTPQSKREPRRLFYVGLTRARHEIHLTYSGWRSTPWGAKKKDGVSEFVLELKNKLSE